MLCTYRHEGLTTIVEVQNSEQGLRVTSLVALGPRLAQQLPLRIKVSAHLASIAAVQGCQEDSNGVVAGQSGDLLVGFIVKLDRCVGQGLLVEVLECVDRVGLCCGQHTCAQEGEGEKD